MITVWKYPFPIQDSFALSLPTGARIVHVEDQRGRACLWAMVDTSRPLDVRHFRVVGTGHEIPVTTTTVHIGSFQQQAGLLVWHLFEEVGP
jgi:hypothetical protein